MDRPSAFRLNSAERQAAEGQRGADPDQAGTAGDAAADPRPRRRCSVGSAVPKAGRTGQNTQRPQITSRAGSRVSMATRATTMPMAQTGPRPLVEFSSANSRQSMLTTTVRGAGDDGRAGPVQRHGHGLVPVLVPAQLLAVAGHQQQGVVGARAEHQDRPGCPRSGR